MWRTEVYRGMKYSISFTLREGIWFINPLSLKLGTARLKRDATRAETTFGLSAKRTSPFKLAGGSVQSTTGSRDLRISSSNGSMLDTPCSEVQCKTIGYPLRSHVSPSLPLPCVTVCHHISTWLYVFFIYTVTLALQLRRITAHLSGLSKKCLTVFCADFTAVLRAGTNDLRISLAFGLGLRRLLSTGDPTAFQMAEITNSPFS
jgi:hypothetical protein